MSDLAYKQKKKKKKRKREKKEIADIIFAVEIKDSALCF